MTAQEFEQHFQSFVLKGGTGVMDINKAISNDIVSNPVTKINPYLACQSTHARGGSHAQATENILNILIEMRVKKTESTT